MLKVKRHHIFFLLALAAMTCVPSAHADGDRNGSLELSAAGGISSPTDKFADIASIGTAYDIAVGITPGGFITLGIEHGWKANDFSEAAKYEARMKYGTAVGRAEYVTSHSSIYAKFLASDNSLTMYARVSAGQWRTKKSIELDPSSISSVHKHTAFLIGLGLQSGLRSHVGAFGEFAYAGFHRRGDLQFSDIQIMVGVRWVTGKLL